MARETFQLCAPITRDKKIIRGIVVIKNPRWGKANAKRNSEAVVPASLKLLGKPAAGPIFFSPLRGMERTSRATDRVRMRTPIKKGRNPGPGFCGPPRGRRRELRMINAPEAIQKRLLIRSFRTIMQPF